MFWTAVKVLFIRQMYSLKHRWIVFLICMAYTFLWLILLVLIPDLFTREDPSSNGHPDGSLTFGDKGTVGVPDPLEIVVMPHDDDTKALLTEAYRNLERQYNSSLNVHLRFAENNESLKHTLLTSTWPSIGLMFHKMAADRLEYTVRPVIRSRAMRLLQQHVPSPSNKYINEYSNWLLRLRAAIDTAYIHQHFPNISKLQIQRLPNSPVSYNDVRVPDAYFDYLPLYFLAHLLLSLSLLFVMSMLASYVITDKLSGTRELLCIYGLPRWMVNVAWLMLFGLVVIILAIIQTVMFKVPPSKPYLPEVNPMVLGILLILNNWTALIFVNAVANLLTHKLATILLIILYWMVTGLMSVILITFRFAEELGTQAFISLLPNLGTAAFFSIMIEHRAQETELSFGNLFSSSKRYISPGVVLIMMLLGMLILLALAVYLDFVKPGPFGRAKPWYLYKRKDITAEHPQSRVSTSDVIIEQLKDAPIGLRCVGIVKVFGAHKALNNVNLSIVKNKITVLLGHNGAGKTTLFSILCGMFSPTSGEVYTDEYSVFEGSNLSRFRDDLGYCPQENLLLNELTVEEHLIIFGMLKGWSKSEAREFSNKWTRMFDMYDRRNTSAKFLSGGTKRKLCLAIAMTGNPKYILLDEPSAGMDIESTRKFRDVLLKEKGNCTVIMTTHDMDEADILGDHIAILAHGQLKCFGSSSFLKKNLDSGYHLNCALSKRNPQDVIKAVNRIARDAAIMYKTNRSVTFNIPGKMEKSIPDLLQGLETQFGDTISTTLSVSTLDDVFIQVHKDIGVAVAVEELPIIPEEEIHRSCWNFIDLFMRRVRWIISRRMIVMIIMVILLPCLGMVCSLYATYAVMRNSGDQQVDGDSEGMFAVISNTSDAVSSILRSTLTNSGVTFTESTKDMKSTLDDLAQQDLYTYRSNLLFAFDPRQADAPTAFFPNRADHSIYEAYAALINAVLQGNATIVTHHIPLTIPQGFADSNLDCLSTSILNFLSVWPFFSFGGVLMLVASSYFVVFPHEERTSLFKHLLLMTGLLPEVYWLVNLLFDMLIYLCSCTTLITVGAIVDHYSLNVFMQPTVIGSFILVLLLYGISSILFSYIWSFIFKSVSIPLVTQILASLFITIGVRILAAASEEKVKFAWSFFIPWSILYSSVTKIFVWAVQYVYCDQFKEQCKIYGCEHYLKEHPSLGGELAVEYICFTVLIVGYFLFLVFLDHGLGSALMGLVMKALCGGIQYSDDRVNSEVALEKERVDYLVNEGPGDQPEILVDGLGKNYCAKTAVYDVTFTAEKGECFGLVGVNGAGKSSTFRMLVALSRPTKGTAVIEGQWKVTGCTYEYLKRLGYCPQSDGLLKELSARNILRLFGRIGGVPRAQIGPLVDKWVSALDMVEIADRPCGKYSGGNKRKLSLAISLIGSPPVILLDEPTAGVDPIVRRRIYEILTSTLENNHKTIILTSHTMSECEAICDRLTIMVNGVMKCLGPIPILKKFFGKSCQLEVKFKTNSRASKISAVRSKIENQFKGRIGLKETHPCRLVFTLNTEDMKMHEAFASMLTIKSDNPVIEDFNLSETPLEQVFLMFAQK